MMPVQVKICGVTDSASIAAVGAGVDSLGFVFARSPRRIDPSRAAELAHALPSTVSTVAVFRHPEVTEIEAVLSTFAPDLIQTEPDVDVLRRYEVSRLWAVLHDSEELVEHAERFREIHGNDACILLEAQGRGGRGIRPSWSRAAELARAGRLVLAGGLTPDNVGEAIRRVRPYGVDVSSGVESRPGIKDPNKIAAFVAAVRTTEQELAS
jgi:phosphoribosylanthranilate isomerase